jgi:hypothetical protein
MNPNRLAAILFCCLMLPIVACAQRGGVPFQSVMVGSEAVPPSSFGMTACARLWLDGTNLVYRFAGAGFTGRIEIRGPAEPGTNGPLLHSRSPGTAVSVTADYCALASSVVIPTPPFGEPGVPIAVSFGHVPLSADQIGHLMNQLLYMNFIVEVVHWPNQIVEFNTRGQITLLDSDGIPDFRDQCPNTPLGSLLNSDGCSIDQLCPCEAPWRNHGEFMNCMKDVLKAFSDEDLISIQQHRELLRNAAQSDCGKQTAN